MRGKLNPVLGALAAFAVVASACSTGSTPSATTAQSAAPSTAPSSAASALKIGVVTDVGSVDDKNFNQYSFEGAKQGASAIGAPEPKYFVPKDSSEYASGIQGFVDQKFDVIVTVGFNLRNDTIKAAKANPNTWFIAVDVGPCIDEQGAPDSTFTCKGDPTKLIPNFVGIQFQEDQAGYLAGMVAATISKKGVIGTIGGINNNPAVVKYMQGYILGAQSIKSDIKVESAFFSTSDPKIAYGDPNTGKTVGAQFITQKGVDVLFPVAGATGNAALDAACTAGIFAIGVDVDEWQSYPTAKACIVTSAEKHLATAVGTTIKNIANGTLTKGSLPGDVAKFDAKNDGIGVSAFHNSGIVPADLQPKLDKALADMKAGTLKTCPDKCGTWQQ